jgi:hypothetical protein
MNELFEVVAGSEDWHKRQWDALKAQQCVWSFGKSTAWHHSWFFLQTRPKFICDAVLLGYGFRIRALHSRKVHGMLNSHYEIEFYWNWRPHPSWAAAVELEEL